MKSSISVKKSLSVFTAEASYLKDYALQGAPRWLASTWLVIKKLASDEHSRLIFHTLSEKEKGYKHRHLVSIL
jgi:hypothetical protein